MLHIFFQWASGTSANAVVPVAASSSTVLTWGNCRPSMSSTTLSRVRTVSAVDVDTVGRVQFAIGDYALEVDAMREYGGQEQSEGLFTVEDSLFRAAEGHQVVCSAVAS